RRRQSVCESVRGRSNTPSTLGHDSSTARVSALNAIAEFRFRRAARAAVFGERARTASEHAPRASARRARRERRATTRPRATVVRENETRIATAIANQRTLENRVALARVRSARRRSRRDELATDETDRTRGLGEDDEGVGRDAGVDAER
ncbi:hypothetical protein N9D08_00590, partial [bacterium]|nr:hypothetical protein [bacterium]